jgi:hypothetical protein
MSQARIVEILETIYPASVAPANKITANAYADVGQLDAEGKTRVVYTILNAHATASLDWKILASIDATTWIELEAEATVAAGASSSWVASATETSYRYFKAQVKSTVAETPSTAQVRGYAKM